MIETLYIVRHGTAVPHGSPDYPDDERPLTTKGEKRVAQVGRGLAKLSVAVDRIVTSPLPRALRTAELLAEALNLADTIETSDRLRVDRTAASIKKWLSERAETRLLVVGHNPWCTELTSLLATKGDCHLSFEMAKGAVAAFHHSSAAGWCLDWVAPPALLRHVK